MPGGLADERRALAATLRSVGPDAPTLAGTWRARDLAAHVAATEQVGGMPTFIGRTLVARYGLRLNDSLRPVMRIDLRRFRRHGFDWAVRRLERPAPALLSRPSILPVSVFEIYVHHEDVLRANDRRRDAAPPRLDASIEWLLRYHRRLLGTAGVLVELPDGRTIHGGGDRTTLSVRGDAGEVLLWLAGRREVADVTVDGDLDVAVRLAV